MKGERFWKKEFDRCGAFWTHSKDFKKPHAQLTSGNHSNFAFNGEMVFSDPFLSNQVAKDLCERLYAYATRDLHIDKAIGPAMGAISLIHDVARLISFHQPHHRCYRAYAEKIESSDGQKFFAFHRTGITPGESVLLVEDVITTGNSINKVAELAEKNGGIVQPIILCILNRSGNDSVHGRKIISLVDRVGELWDRSNCPLCIQGGVALSVKNKKNWEKLSG